MRVGRLILVVATLFTVLIFPVLLRDAIRALQLPNAYAAPTRFDAGGRVYQDGNTNNNNGNSNNNGGDNDNTRGNGGSNNNNSNSNGNGNDNIECFANLNSNEAVPCDFNTNGNANDNNVAPPPAPAAPAPPPAPSSTSSRCFGAGETGDVQLILDGGSVTIRVVPPAGLPSQTQIGLSRVDPATVPAPPSGATLLDTLVWSLSGQNGCGGSGLNSLPGAVNLGISYGVSANKSKLQIVHLTASNTWEEVPTVPDPDPNKPYISATIQNTGTYAVIQKP